MPRVVDFGNCFLQLPTVVRARQNVDIVESSVLSFGHNGLGFYPIPIEVSIFIVLYVMECCFCLLKTAGRARGNCKEEATNSEWVDAERNSRNGLSFQGI